MTLSVADYTIIAAVIAAVVLKILSDISEIKAAKFTKNAVTKIAKKNFSPILTMLIPLESLDDAKSTLEHLDKFDFPKSVIVIHTKKGPKDARTLRYFIKKHSFAWARVATQKRLSTAAIERRYVKSGLVVILPDTARLSSTFYWDAVMPFGDEGLDALVLSSSTRPGKTLASGIEVLMTAWRRYVNLTAVHKIKNIHYENLPQGVIVRAKQFRRMPEKEPFCIQTRKAAYSVSAQKSFGSSWRQLQKANNVSDFVAAFLMTIAGALLLQKPEILPLTIGTMAIIYGMIIWWALSVARIAIVDRVSVLLLSPIFIIIAWGLTATQFSHRVTRIRSA